MFRKGNEMIYDILDVFRKEYALKGDKLILDNYQLKDGLYVKVNDAGNLMYFIKTSRKVKKDGKTETEHDFKDVDGVNQSLMYEWFKERDYYSNVIDTSKAYDAPKKTIHNNNYLTLFMKIEEFLNVEFSHIEEKLFKKVLGFKSFDSKNEKKILKNYCYIVKSFCRKRDLVNKLRILKLEIENIRIIVKEYSPKEYIRIFFDKDIDTYKNESSIYLALKIFNDNKYSIESNDAIVYGLSNFNMGLNSKKPYLEHKTKKLSTPFMVTSDMALDAKLFSDWISLQKYKTDALENMYLNRHSDNGKPIINGFDYLPLKIDIFDKAVKIKNYLHVENISDFDITQLRQLENVIDEIFYSKQLKHNYFNDDLKVSQYVSKNLQTLILETKSAMINYFKKYREKEFYQVIQKYGSDFIIEHIRQGRTLKAPEALNLKFSLLHYKGETVMDIQEMQKKMIEKLETSNYDGLNSEEFFYLCGQVAKYLLSQSEAHEKNADLMEPFLRANNAQKLKKEIEFTYFNYKHKISINYTKFNNALSVIMAYENKDGLSEHRDSFLVGVLSQNIFYMKKEEN